MSLDQPSDFVKHQTVTRDAFLAGRITLSQPRNGFRAGFDSVLLGAAVQAGTQNLLDLGAGVGTAGLVALALGRAEKAVLVERHAETAALARDNIVGNGLDGRAEVLGLDILSPGPVRAAAGLKANHFGTVIANPPFFEAGQGTLAPEASRADARHMAQQGLESWVRCAAGCAAADGAFIIVYPAAGLVALLAALAPRFGALTILPISPRPGLPASRVLIRGKKGSRAPLTLLASRALHGTDGRDFAPEFDAIFRGEAALDW
jgi:tRNA1(Val) A37 N6-methylase TrmN6